MLMDQYKSVSSTKNKEYIDSKIFNQSDKNAITDVEITENDIRTAIDGLRENSPPIFLKRQRGSIVKQ